MSEFINYVYNWINGYLDGGGGPRDITPLLDPIEALRAYRTSAKTTDSEIIQTKNRLENDPQNKEMLARLTDLEKDRSLFVGFLIPKREDRIRELILAIQEEKKRTDPELQKAKRSADNNPENISLVANYKKKKIIRENLEKQLAMYEGVLNEGISTTQTPHEYSSATTTLLPMPLPTAARLSDQPEVGPKKMIYGFSGIFDRSLQDVARRRAEELEQEHGLTNVSEMPLSSSNISRAEQNVPIKSIALPVFESQFIQQIKPVRKIQHAIHKTPSPTITFRKGIPVKTSRSSATVPESQFLKQYVKVASDPDYFPHILNRNPLALAVYNAIKNTPTIMLPSQAVARFNYITHLLRLFTPNDPEEKVFKGAMITSFERLKTLYYGSPQTGGSIHKEAAALLSMLTNMKGSMKGGGDSSNNMLDVIIDELRLL